MLFGIGVTFELLLHFSAIKYYSNFVLYCLQLLMNGPTVIYSFPNVLSAGEGLPKCHFYQAVCTQLDVCDDTLMECNWALK